MTDDVHSRQAVAPARGAGAGRRKILLALATAILLILAFIFVPPLVSISKYKARIAQLISTSLGRPVRLSSVELRLLPRPGFVITDLSVAEDPAYGAEPVLHANTVTASIRLLSLWRGRLAIDSISVDEASLNIVRAGPGRWNLDPLFRTAAVKAGSVGSGGPARDAVPLPYLEATNSRINIKNGAEKLPFSLVNTDFEFWQPDPGEWRIRLRGQPARTDVSLSLEDTGELRMEASIHRAPELSEMPVHIDLDWREAQLGQLARLVTGSDPGWRGDLTGELHLDGTADSAHITTRLRATGVHRAEFAPAEPLDFDANCAFVYRNSLVALENLDCNSPLGDGRIQLTGDLAPGQLNDLARGVKPSNLTLALDRISVGAGLDLLRTVRSGLPADLAASGAISGKLAYNAATAGPASQVAVKPGRRKESPQPPPGPLTGSLTVDGFQLSGGGLSRPIQASKMVLEPVADPHAAADSGVSLVGSLAGSMFVPAGGASPLTIDFRLALAGYHVALHGPASLASVRELARAAGFAAAGLDGLAGDPAALDLNAQGPWLPAAESAAESGSANGKPALPVTTSADQSGDSLTGTVTLRNANWRADFLAGPLEIAQATLQLGDGRLRWDPVVFTYGAVKGTASLDLPANCSGPEPCVPQFRLAFGDLDAARLQTAILGVHEQGSLLSGLIDRLHPSSAPLWPRLQGTVKADSLVLGPVTLRQPSATVRIDPDGAKITDLDAGLLGGQVQLSVSLEKPASDQDKPAYQLDGSFQKVSPPALGQLIGLRSTGEAVSGNGKVEFSGYTAADLAASAKGTLHFEWDRGAITAPAATRSTRPTAFPPALARFDHWTADAAIANNAITLGQNQVHRAGRDQTVAGSLTFAEPPRVTFTRPSSTAPDARNPAH
jgi:AsmA protein